MSIEQASLHTIRMSTQDWNELLVTAVNAGYKSRAEYIRAILKGELLRQNNPLTEIVPNDPMPMTLEVEMELCREISAHKAEIAKLRDTAQEIKPHTVLTTSANGKKPVHRFSLSSIVKRWPDTQQARYNGLGVKPDEWIKKALETAYDMLDELGA